jgi:Ca2+-binding EF-hand superfamily protein
VCQCLLAAATRMPLTQEEIDGCKDAFTAYDKDRSGTIEVWELKEVLEGT